MFLLHPCPMSLHVSVIMWSHCVMLCQPTNNEEWHRSFRVGGMWLQFQSIADEVGVSCVGTVQCLCLVATLLTATWCLYSHQKREGEGLCWLTLAGTDPGQWWCCVSSPSSSSSFGRPSFSCSIICHAGSFVIHCLVDHCLVPTLLTVTWCLLSLSEEGGGGIMLAYLGWHRTWTVMTLCVITIILFQCRVSEVVSVDVKDRIWEWPCWLCYFMNTFYYSTCIL